jgi:hypothetical protein
LACLISRTPYQPLRPLPSRSVSLTASSLLPPASLAASACRVSPRLHSLPTLTAAISRRWPYLLTASSPRFPSHSARHYHSASTPRVPVSPPPLPHPAHSRFLLTYFPTRHSHRRHLPPLSLPSHRFLSPPSLPHRPLLPLHRASPVSSHSPASTPHHFRSLHIATSLPAISPTPPATTSPLPLPQPTHPHFPVPTCSPLPL